MLRILILSDSFNGYGAEHMLKWLGNNLYSHGFKVTFCSIFDTERNSDLIDDAKYCEMRLEERHYDRKYFLNGIRFLGKLCQNHSFDFIVTFHTNPYLIALLARPFCGYKILHSERDNPYARNTIPSRLKSWLYRYADKLVFQTEGAQQYFDEKTQKKSIVIPNPIEIPESSWKGGVNKSLVSVGRLDIHFKRQDILLDAFAEIVKDYPDYNVVFYGEGKDREKLEVQANDLGIANHVIFMGKVSGVLDKLVEEGIFVMTSDSEGMPNALMEAMALGMPVVSTDCQPGGARALLCDGIDGILVTCSSKSELSVALRRILSDEYLQRKLGENARLKMTKFNPELIINKWIAFINYGIY